MIDIVAPNGNEKEFIEMAKRLGYDSICFYYEKNRAKDIKDKSIMVFYASPSSGKADIVLCRQPGPKEFAAKNIDVWFDMESTTQRDKMATLSSGFNHVTASQAAESSTIIGLSYAGLFKSQRQQSRLGRMRQNIRLCRKYGVEMAIFSFATNPYHMRSAEDLKSFFAVIGMHPKEAKDAFSSIQKRIQRNARKKKGLYIMEGLEKI